MSEEIKVALLGCGLIGRRRLETMVREKLGKPIAVFDPIRESAKGLARDFDCEVLQDPERAWASDGIDAVIVSTPNCFLANYGVAILESGKHLLVEKPGACSKAEWERLAAVQGNRVAKIGFNHRFHPAALELHNQLKDRREGEKLSWIRGAYGHGGRPGYESEWRFDPALSGGGEVIDQGVHLLDLAGWYTGEALTLNHADRLNAHYAAAVEDNGFLSLGTESGVRVQLHCSVTQWKNLFRFEVGTSHRLFVWEGLGNRNYGEEVLTIHERKPEGGAPMTQRLLFSEEKSDSWTKEWIHFKQAMKENTACWSDIGQAGWMFEVLDRVHEFECFQQA